MAITFANLGSSANPDINSSTDATSYVNTSWTPPTSGLILAWVVTGEATGLCRVTSMTGNSLTWTKIISMGFGGSAVPRRITLMAARASGATTGATTVNVEGTSLLGLVSFIHADGTFNGGDIRDLFPQSGGTKLIGSVTGVTVVFQNQEASSASRPVAAFYHGTNEATTPDGSYVEADDLAGAGPTHGFETQWADSWVSTASASWATATTNSVGVGVEISETGPGTPTTGDGTIDSIAVSYEGSSFIGPFKDSNGNLYTVTEMGEGTVDSRPVIRKSHDGGLTWLLKDGGSSPFHSDLESVWCQQFGTEIRVGWQQSNGEVYYEVFGTSDDSTNPDRWNDTITGEIVQTPVAPTDQSASLAVRSDGVTHCFYAVGGTDESIRYRKRLGAASWDTEQTITVAGNDLSQVTTVVDGSDVVHIFIFDFTAKDVLYYTLTGDTLAGPTTVTATGVHATLRLPLLNPVLTSTGVYVAWLSSTNVLDGSHVVSGSPGGPATITAATVRSNLHSSEGPFASLARDGDTTYALWSDSATGDIFRDSRVSGSWGTDVEVADAVNVAYINGNVFTHSAGNGGDKVLGYIWGDEGTLHGSESDPTLHYSEIVLEEGGAAAGPKLYVVSSPNRW